MSLQRDIAEATEMKPKLVRQVYDALVDQVRSDLKNNRRCRLPGIGVVAIRFKPARKAGWGMSFGKKTKFKAKPAMNKLKFRAAKDLRTFTDKLPKVAPKKKRH